MTLTLDLETCFKATAHLLPKGTLWMKYDPDWAKRKEDMIWTSDLGQTDGWTDERMDRRMDGQTDHYRFLMFQEI